jgi:hypothetical protein
MKLRNGKGVSRMAFWVIQALGPAIFITFYGMPLNNHLASAKTWWFS